MLRQCRQTNKHVKAVSPPWVAWKRLTYTRSALMVKQTDERLHEVVGKELVHILFVLETPSEVTRNLLCGQLC